MICLLGPCVTTYEMLFYQRNISEKAGRVGHLTVEYMLACPRCGYNGDNPGTQENVAVLRRRKSHE